MKINKIKLLLLAALVWVAAGFNILRIGIISYQSHVTVINILISAAVFLVFWFMVFGRLVKKHTNRIVSYEEEKQFFLKFFDVKSFLIMAFMMTFGIGLRVSGICPDVFIAVFYSGLGAALTLAGVLFGYHFIKKGKEKNAGYYGNTI